MTTSPKSNPVVEGVVLAILLEAKEAGYPKIVRTALLKFIYLVDLFYAQETSGQTWTGARWYFHHFGPFSDEALATIEHLAAHGLVEQAEGSSGDRDYYLYSLGEWSKAKSFEALGLSRDVRMGLAEAIRAFAYDLNGLLDYIYFDTEPMRYAKPGEALSFASAKKIDYKADFRLAKIPINDAKKVARIRELAHAIGQQYQARKRYTGAVTPGIYDEAFVLATASEDDATDASQIFSAALSFDNDRH